jgi:hypothetical protein
MFRLKLKDVFCYLNSREKLKFTLTMWFKFYTIWRV